MENNELHLYFEALEKKVGGKQYLVSEEEALRVLRLCQYNQRKALRIFGVTEKVSHEGETDDDESGEEIDSDPETDEAETLAEDHCFVCKEEGTLLLCDFKDCFKGYHCACLNMSEDTLPDGDWVCPLHSCKVCQKLPDPDTSCKMCPTAYCAYCNVNFPVGPAIESHLCGPCTKFVRETILPHGEGYLKVQFLQSKSLFVNLLQSFHERFGRPLTSFEPTNSTDLDRFDVYQLYSIVCSYGGFDVVERFGIWELISCNMGMSPDRRTACSLKEYYKDAILMFEEEFAPFVSFLIFRYFVTEELGIQERLSKFLKREQMDMDILAPVANE